ncbi:MAG: hypothetical protein ACFFDN_00350 [Candidatus Hodarchaeota archaeon]
MDYGIKKYKPQEKTEFTTKEVATRLGISTDSLHKLRKQHKMKEQGLVRVEMISTDKGSQKGYLWTVDAIKFAIQKLPSIQKEWKEEIKDKFIENGFVVSNEMHPVDKLEIVLTSLLKDIQIRKKEYHRLLSLSEDSFERHEKSENRLYQLELENEKLKKDLDHAEKKINELRGIEVYQVRKIQDYKLQYLQLYKNNPFKILREKYDWIYGISKDSVSLYKYTYNQAKLIIEWFEKKLLSQSKLDSY